MNTFGGFSTSLDISSFLLSIQSDFVSMVRSYNVLLNPTKDSQIIQVAKLQSYPRIGLILSAAKDLDNTYLFSDLSDPTNLNLLYSNVIRLMTSPDSPFSEGITRVAASLTAAILMRAIPIDSDIKNVSLGDSVEKSAIYDLNEIIKLYSTSSSSNSNISSTNLDKIYISLSVDPSTLPHQWFNFDPLNKMLDISSSYPTADLRSLTSINVDKSEIPVCWFYLTKSEHSQTLLSTVSPVGITIIPNNADLIFIVQLITDSINELMNILNSNIILAPNLIPNVVSSLVLSKKDVYPDLQDSYSTKLASVNSNFFVYELGVSSRIRSSIISNDLISLRFLTIPKSVYVSTTLPNAVYVGDWSPNNVYTQGNIVSINDTDYVLLASSSTEDPTTSDPTIWSILRYEEDRLSQLVNHSNTKKYVSGLLHGTNLYSLRTQTISSLIVGVDKGTVTSNSPITTTQDDLIAPDTFYFNTSYPVVGKMTCRVSSSLLTSVSTFDIDLLNASAEDIALLFLQSLYSVSSSTHTLGALVFPNATQIVAYKITSAEVRVVVDILNVPNGLEIATGTILTQTTPFKSKPRSVNVSAVLDRSNSNSINSNTNIISVSSIKSTKSARLQGVYDKLDFIKQLENRNHLSW